MILPEWIQKYKEPKTFIKKIGNGYYYHSHDFCSEFWAKNALSDKLISANLKYLGENRQLAVE